MNRWKGGFTSYAPDGLFAKLYSIPYTRIFCMSSVIQCPYHCRFCAQLLARGIDEHLVISIAEGALRETAELLIDEFRYEHAFGFLITSTTGHAKRQVSKRNMVTESGKSHPESLIKVLKELLAKRTNAWWLQEILKWPPTVSIEAGYSTWTRLSSLWNATVVLLTLNTEYKYSLKIERWLSLFSWLFRILHCEDRWIEIILLTKYC